MPPNAARAHSDVPVDHVIFHAGQALDELAGFFARLGFTLTPPGRHNSGSVNRLAMLPGQYIELIGFAPGTPPTVRPEVQSLPLGLTGIAAADLATHVRRSAHHAFLPGRRLERPVELPGVHGLAAFTTTELREGAPDVRVFLCRHHTPELVWQPAWQQHANGALAVTQVRVRSRDAQRLRRALHTVFDSDAADATELDAAGTTLQVAAADERPCLTVRTADLDATRKLLAAAGVLHTLHEDRVTVPLPAPYEADLVFVAG